MNWNELKPRIIAALRKRMKSPKDAAPVIGALFKYDNEALRALEEYPQAFMALEDVRSAMIFHPDPVMDTLDQTACAIAAIEGGALDVFFEEAKPEFKVGTQVQQCTNCPEHCSKPKREIREIVKDILEDVVEADWQVNSGPADLIVGGKLIDELQDAYADAYGWPKEW